MWNCWITGNTLLAFVIWQTLLTRYCKAILKLLLLYHHSLKWLEAKYLFSKSPLNLGRALGLYLALET